MKRAFAALFLLAVLLPGCGGSAAQPSAFCQSVATVKEDINTLKSLRSNPSLSALKTTLQKLQTDVNHAITEAKGASSSQVSALKSSMKDVKGTLTQVKSKTLTVRDAVPTLKTQAQTVSQNWKALTDSMKC